MQVGFVPAVCASFWLAFALKDAAAAWWDLHSSSHPVPVAAACQQEQRPALAACWLRLSTDAWSSLLSATRLDRLSAWNTVCYMAPALLKGGCEPAIMPGVCWAMMLQTMLCPAGMPLSARRAGRSGCPLPCALAGWSGKQ